MKEILHLVRFDARAVRVPLGLWTIFLMAGAMEFYAGPINAGVTGTSGRDYWPAIIGIVRVVGTAIVTAMLVHLDATGGFDALWKTRPVGRGLLLTSKAISVGLWLLVLPAAVAITPLLVLGMDAIGASRCGWDVLRVQAQIVVVAFAGAAITTNLLRFALVMLGGSAAGLVFFATDGFKMRAVLPGLKVAVTPEVYSTLGSLALAAVAVIVVYQYLTWRLRYTLAWLTALAVIALWFGSFNVIDYSTRQIGPFPHAPDDVVGVSALTLAADVSTQQVRSDTEGPGIQRRTVSFRLSWANVDPDVVPTVPMVRSLLTFANGEQLYSTNYLGLVGPAFPALAPEGQPWRAISRVLGTADIPIGDSEWWNRGGRLNVTRVPEATYRRHEGETVRVTSTLEMWAFRFRVVSVLPLKAGQSRQLGTDVLSIERVAMATAGPTVTLRIMGAPRAPFVRWVFPLEGLWLLRSPARRQAVRAEARQISLSGQAGVFGLSSLYRLRLLVTPEGPGRLSRLTTIDDAWMSDAELIRVETEPLGSFTRQLTIDGFVLGGVAK